MLKIKARPKAFTGYALYSSSLYQGMSEAKVEKIKVIQGLRLQR
jgi:hypothetical protein